MPFLIKLLFFIALLTPLSGVAHESRPAYLGLSETTANVFDVLWKRPEKSGKVLALNITFPSHCRTQSDVTDGLTRGVYEERWQLNCGEHGLTGYSIAVVGLVNTITDVLVHVEFANGSTRQGLLRAADPVLVIQPNPSQWQVITDYISLGVEHILGGVDHLFFVLELLILVSSTRLLLLTISAFTLAHSVTLATATLGIVRIPQVPIEAVIALSIVFLSCEILRAERGGDGLTLRYPWLVALSFGLLHGLGFAGALAEVGLPPQAIPLALLMFNLGVELGQLAFVVAVLLVGKLCLKHQNVRRQLINQLSAYGMGSVATFWFFERVIAF